MTYKVEFKVDFQKVKVCVMEDEREIRRHNEYILRRALPGDLLEFPRQLGYSHWGVYGGDKYVIHLAGEPGDGMSADDAAVRKDNFWTVAGTSRTKINNIWDGVEKLQPARDVVRRAESKMGCKGYNLISTNCEHFAAWCRYDVARSSQVEAVHSTIRTTLTSVGEVLSEAAATHPDPERRSEASRLLAIEQNLVQLTDQFMKEKSDKQLKGLSSK